MLPGVVVEMIDTVADVGHAEALRLSGGDPKTLVDILKKLDDFLCRLDEKTRYLRGMRAVCVQADVYRMLSDPKIWRRRKVPPVLPRQPRTRFPERTEKDRGASRRLRSEYRGVAAPRHDGRPRGHRGAPRNGSLPLSRWRTGITTSFSEVVSPLRLGISSANASDNHIRTKEQGGKTLNAGIDLCTDGSGECRPPLTVSVRRLEEKALVLRSLSKGFEAEFEINARGAPAVQSDLFFAYRRGGDESLRMVKEALVHCGIISRRTGDVVEEVSELHGGRRTGSHHLQRRSPGIGTRNQQHPRRGHPEGLLTGLPVTPPAPKRGNTPSSTTRASCSNRALGSTQAGRTRVALAAVPAPPRICTPPPPRDPRSPTSPSSRWTPTVSPSASCCSTPGSPAPLRAD